MALTDQDRAELQSELDFVKKDSVLTAEEMRLIITGHFVEALRSVRARLKITLKEAHDLCEAFRDSR